MNVFVSTFALIIMKCLMSFENEATQIKRSNDTDNKNTGKRISTK
jgi:hypothetical protein